MNTTDKWKCKACHETFTTKYSLQRHTNNRHSSTLSPSFTCKTCGKTFTMQQNLRRHTISLHYSNLSVFFKCRECSRTFKRNDQLKQHVELVHTNVNSLMLLECAHCAKKFAHKIHLQRHLINSHGKRDKLFECHDCGVKYDQKFKLGRHIKMTHILDAQRKYYECVVCSMVFRQKRRITKHIRECHNITPRITASKMRRELKCVKCAELFRTKKILNTHYEQIHSIAFDYDNLQFESMKLFDEWRIRMEDETITQFVRRDCHDTSQNKVTLFNCHRCGSYSGTAKENERKRHLKLSGYKGIGGYCPAEIRVVESKNDGFCNVRYLKTHVGHNVGDKSELKFMFLHQKERLNLAAKLQNGIPASLILKDQNCANPPGGNITRRSLLKKHDLHNIAASFNIPYSARERIIFSSDVVSIDAFVSKHCDDILFYKSPNEEDTVFQVFDKTDFALILMSPRQKENLLRYGRKVIAMDGMYSVNPCDFILHSVLVKDVDCEGYPVAFLLTNRNDRSALDVFLKCLRDEVGIIETQTFISDTQNMYYESWISIMTVPEHRLYCILHVREAWKTNYNKIPDKQKRKDTEKKLFNLSKELDPMLFELKLNEFLSLQDDPEMRLFIQYFCDNYCRNTSCWAYCYRLFAGVNTNISLEVFHAISRKKIADRKNIKSMFQCLHYMYEYIAYKETDDAVRQYRGKITYKLSILRRRHREAISIDGITMIDGQTFLVESDSSECTYTVTKVKSKECTLYGDDVVCRLPCVACNRCFHEFQCTCEDNAIYNNMCKHIHAVGILLQKRKDDDDTNAVCNVNAVVTDNPIYFDLNIGNLKNVTSTNINSPDVANVNDSECQLESISRNCEADAIEVENISRNHEADAIEARSTSRTHGAGTLEAEKQLCYQMLDEILSTMTTAEEILQFRITVLEPAILYLKSRLQNVDVTQ